jgi:multidrug efflux pump subunit AcrA (membrane-fusion protein)
MKTKIIVINYLLIGLLFSVGCKNKTETITPTKSNITESVYAAGVVKSENQYEVFSQINGKIVNIFVKEGDLVKKGQPLFKLENTNTQLSTVNAQISAEANDYVPNHEKLIDAQNTIELARKNLNNEYIMLARQQKLWAKDIGTKVELEQRELSLENAKVNVRKAELAYKNINRQLKLTSDQSKNQLKIAQSTEDNLIIRSEVDGLVYKISVKQGESATSTKPIAIVGQKNFIIEFNVDEFDIVKIQKGQKVIIRMDSYEKKTFEAQINFIYPMMDEQKRSFRIEAIFTKEPILLYPNLTLEANIIINEKKNVLTIPTNYLANNSYVILEDGTVKKVTIGLKDYSTIEILNGIDENTKISMPKE